MKRLFIPFLALALCSSAEAGLGPVTSSVPDWNIHRSVDAFNTALTALLLMKRIVLRLLTTGSSTSQCEEKVGWKMSRVRYNIRPS